MDEADILKLDEAGLHKRLNVIIVKVKRIDDDDPKEESDPRIRKLLDEGRLICARLDPIMRERFRDDPAALAEWDEIMHMCDDIYGAPETGEVSELPR
jgi:regulator of replication initiation timing